MASDDAADHPPIHVIVTCSNRKTIAVPDDLRLGHLRQQGSDERFNTWTERLSAATVPRVLAHDLYAGEHWHVARQLPTRLSRPASLWICSAGYGLIAANSAIAPYAATFAAGELDSVGSTPAEMRAWWNRLTTWRRLELSQPRSIADLASREPGATIIAVLSEAYMRACADDLRRAADHLNNQEQLMVIGPPGRCADIEDLIVPVTANLRPLVGGSLQALNVRVAARLLEAAANELSRATLRKHAEQATSSAPPDHSRRLGGQRLTDDEVRSYIRDRLAAGPGSATGLLRLLRQSGQSCEQARFGLLFTEVAAEVRR
ncbi:hypothetical protein ACQP1P_01580 [Dactylosporangium sp. CA-052675]|uniref:hypothetical protein n=1 Tax=Dactylosporangium sp. CA-052675 TaxID=3239927 RepID=UPI003D93CB37